MRARAFTKRVGVWQTQSFPDGVGGFLVLPTKITDSWAKVETLQPGKSKNATQFGIVDANDSIMFTLNKRNDINYNVGDMFIVYRGVKYTISTAPTDINFTGNTIVFIGAAVSRKSNINTGLDDHYPQNDCVSIADIDSLGAWTHLGNVNLSVTTENTGPDSEYALRVESYITGQGNAQNIISGLEIGATYIAVWENIFLPGGLPDPTPAVIGWLGVEQSPAIDLSLDLTLTLRSAPFVPIAGSVYMNFFAVTDDHDGTGDAIVLDKMRIFKTADAPTVNQ